MSLHENYRYSQHIIDLSVAHNDTMYATGLSNAVMVRSIDDLNSLLEIKFDRTDNETIRLRQGDIFNFRNIATPSESIYFNRIYFTNVAVPAPAFAVLIYTQNIEFARRLRLTSDIIQHGVLQQVVSIGAVPTPIPLVAYGNRINMLIQNTGANTIFIGSATVTAAGATQGIQLPVNATMNFTISESVVLYGIVAAGAENLNILEGS